MPHASPLEVKPNSMSGPLGRGLGAVTSAVNLKIFRAVTILSGLSGVVLAATTVRELVVANYFGRSDALDAYVTAYVLPLFIVNLVSKSFDVAVIPTFVEVRESEGAEVAQRLFSGALVWSLALLVTIAVLLAAFAPYYLPWLASGFSSSKLLLTRKLLYFMLPLIVMSAVTVNGTALLNVGERFAMPALLPVLPPIGGLLCLIEFGKRWGIYSLAAGTVTGTALQAASLVVLARSHGVSLRPCWHGLDPKLRQVIGQYIPMVAGALLMGTTELVDQAMAAMLQPGSVAALGYARKIVNVLVVVGAIPLGAATLPYFSDMVAKRAWDACRHTLRTYTGLIFLVTVPITAGMVVFARPLVRILFQRGAFTAMDTTVVSHTEAWLALQVPFYLAGNMAVRLISALKRNGVLMLIAAVNTVLNAVLNWVLMKRYGVAGIALSTSIVYLVSCVLVFGSLYVLLRHKSTQLAESAPS